MIHTITLGRHQIAVKYNRKRGRPSKSTRQNLAEFYSQIHQKAQSKRYGGHPFSRVMRFLLENKKTRQVFGANLTAFVLFAGMVAPVTSAFTSQETGEAAIPNQAVISLTTEKSVRNPLDSFEITQGYHLFHRAIDFRDYQGAPVYPIMDGVVEQANYQRFGYGNHVIVDHGAGFKSLYAHFSKIVVKSGQKVDQNTVLGTVGTTGRATGAHLHLEVYDHGQPFNPLAILGD
jgi:murein DD-endopeptidase MepM/ murein hydrolase activator NlpD